VVTKEFDDGDILDVFKINVKVRLVFDGNILFESNKIKGILA